MFMGPLEADKPWDSKGVEGSRRFLDRVWRIFAEEHRMTEEETPNLEKIYHKTVKKVTEDYETLNFNTAISAMMVFINACYKEEKINRNYVEGFVQLLNPLAPHMTEEIWHKTLHHEESIASSKWPTYDIEKTKDETYQMVVQVNGKLRGKIETHSDTTKEEMIELAKSIENVQKFIEGKEIVKEIVVPKKLVNIVIKG